MRHSLLTIVIVLVITMGLSSCLCQPRYASFLNLVEKIDSINSYSYTLQQASPDSGVLLKDTLAKELLGAPCFNMTMRFPMESFLLEPVVRKLVVIGTCVEKPNRLAAVTPVGIITALSLLAISAANSEAEGYSMPKRVLRALTYTPFDIREIIPSFSNIASSLVTYSTSY